ncbi:hypothetical protein ACOME3_008511 [Neoechinorhynchus agilis]
MCIVDTSGGKRRLIPTSLGLTLIHGYEEIDPELCEPHMRSALEKQLMLIARGHARFEDVLTHTLRIFEAKYHYFVSKITAMDNLMQDCFDVSADLEKKMLSRCGKCLRFMNLIGFGSRYRLHCGNCKNTYQLPRSDTSAPHPYGEKRCPLDEFELITVSQSNPAKSMVVCPYCFNRPPFEGMRPQNDTCNRCLHPSCPQSFKSEIDDKRVKYKEGDYLKVSI